MRRTSCLTVLTLGTAVLGSIASLGAGGCQPGPAVTVVHLGPGDRTDSLPGDTVKTRRGVQETFTGLRKGYFVVRNVEDWERVWPEGRPPPPLPSMLDRSQSMLLLDVAEKEETVSVEITRVVETGNSIHVWVKETQAGENCRRARGAQTPFDAVVAPLINKPVKFHVQDEHAPSCGDPPAVTVSCRANNAPKWSSAVTAQPGDKVECEMRAETRGTFALIDNVLSLGELPAGSSTKLAYTSGPARGTFTVDIFGKYAVRAEAADESGRRSVATATIDAMPPKTKDVIVQLVWANFDISDDPDTFPRVKLRAFEEGKDAKNRPIQNECSLENPRPELCEVKARSAYTHMRLKAGTKRVPLDVLYTDERVDKGPLVCVQVYLDGARTGETCDRKHRNPDERWQIGAVAMDTGKLEPAAEEADGGAPDGGATGAAIKKPLRPRIPAPRPGPPVPPAPRRPKK